MFSYIIFSFLIVHAFSIYIWRKENVDKNPNANENSDGNSVESMNLTQQIEDVNFSSNAPLISD